MMNTAFANIGDLDKATTMPLTVQDSVAVEHCDTIYYGPSASHKKSACDVLANTRFEQQFQSLNIPGSVTLQIPNISIVDTIIMHVAIPSFPQDCNLPRGWGHLLIDRVDLRIGSSITLTFSGQTILHELLMKCKNASSSGKRSRLFELCGQARTTSSATRLDAYIPLNVPVLSAIANDKSKLPFDLGMLNLPAQVVVYWNSLASICGGSGVSNLPTSFSVGSFIARQLDFKDVSNSMKNDLIMNPAMSYTHPFVYNQSIALPCISSNSPSTPVLVSLTGFRYGTLESVGFYLLKNLDVNSPGANAKNVFNTQVLNDIKLTFNGQLLYSAPANSHELLNLALSDDSPNMVLNAVVSGTSTATFVATAVDSYLYDINLAQYNPLSEQGVLQSGLVVGNNTLSLQFTTPASNLETCVLYVSYRYAAGCKVSNGGSQVDFIF